MTNTITHTEQLNILGIDVTRTFGKYNGLPQQQFSIKNGPVLEPIFTQTIIGAPQNANTSYSISSHSDLYALGTSRINLHLDDVVNKIKENHAWQGISSSKGQIETSVNGELLTL